MRLVLTLPNKSHRHCVVVSDIFDKVERRTDLNLTYEP